MEKKKPSTTHSLPVRIFLLSALFIILSPALDLHAASYPSLTKTSIKELELAAQNCLPRKRAKFSVTVHPPAFHLWPSQKVLISWWVNNQKGERWIFPVYLRKAGKKGGEQVSPIWMHSIKSDDLPEGLNTFYLVTYCGVAKMKIAMAPRPEILIYPISALRGDTIRIAGEHFNEWDPKLLREIKILEQGGTRDLIIEKWTDNEIIATLPEDLFFGRQKLYIASGTTKRRSRRSEELPLAIVNQDDFPSLTIASLLEDVFSRMNIHLNNYGSQRSGSRLKEKDSYISFSEEPDSERFYLNIPEYKLVIDSTSPVPGKDILIEKAGHYSYYLNNLNMDNVTVSRLPDGWSMTIYFEKIDDELIGVDTDITDIRAFVPVEKRPLRMQIDNLKVVVDFDLTAKDGIMVVSQKKIESFGSLSSSEAGCIFNSVDICERLKEVFETELLKQLSKAMELALAAESTRAFFAEAVDPWLAGYSMGEVIELTFDDDNVVLNYLPR